MDRDTEITIWIDRQSGNVESVEPAWAEAFLTQVRVDGETFISMPMVVSTSDGHGWVAVFRYVDERGQTRTPTPAAGGPQETDRGDGRDCEKG